MGEAPQMALQGNKAIEDAAIAWGVELEQAAGRDARDTRYRGAPGDVESGDRIIEVKAFGKSDRGLGYGSRRDRWTRPGEGRMSTCMFLENVRVQAGSGFGWHLCRLSL